jgi:bifunctional non-homologous end joining protein LigD
VSALDSLSPAERELLKPAARPDKVTPMKAMLTDDRFSDPDWIYERKLDGIRCIAIKAEQRVRLLSRNDLSLNARFGEVVAALELDPVTDVVLDGEVVGFAVWLTSFERLQQRGERPVHVFYYVFDILHLDGHDVTALPLRARKGLLRHALAFHGPVRFTTHRNGEGEALYREACRKGWEGVIAKNGDSTYVSKRTRDWLKFKCIQEQEFVIGGYTDPRGERIGFGALLVGFYRRGKLEYAGKVGTGFDTDTLQRLGRKLVQLETDTCPFVGDGLPRRGVHWVKPKLVAQIGFTEWTAGDKLRHPRFLGLREDKKPDEVVREG